MSHVSGALTKPLTRGLFEKHTQRLMGEPWVGIRGVGRVADSTVFCRAVTSCSMDHQLLQIYRYWFRGSVKMEPIPVGELGSAGRYLGS